MRKLLVVDDEASIRFSIRQVFESPEVEVLEAENADQALRLAREAEPHVVLLDVRLGSRSGLDVFGELKRFNPRGLIIFITGHGTTETAIETMKLGALDYLQKPFTPEEIRNVVATVLARQHVSEKEAQQSFQAALEYARGCLKRARPGEAVPHLRRAVSLNPDNPEPYNMLGLVAELRGDLLEALKMYRAALAVDPSYRPALANLERATSWRYTPPARQA